MKRILIAFSTTRYHRDLMAQAIEEAQALKQEGVEASFELLYVLENKKLQSDAKAQKSRARSLRIAGGPSGA